MIGRILRRVVSAFDYRLEADLPCFLHDHTPRIRPTPQMLLAWAEHCIPRPTVLQLGANDGRRFDALRPFLEHSSWSGLLVEGDPALYEQLRSNNSHRLPRIQTLQCVLGDGQPTTFYSPDPDRLNELPEWALGIGGLNRQHIEKHAVHHPNLMEFFVERRVQTVTINDLICHQLGFCPDVLYTDLEGYDAEVLEDLDFTRFAPRIIIFESEHISRNRMNSVFTMLGSCGYHVDWGPGDSTAIRLSSFDL